MYQRKRLGLRKLLISDRKFIIKRHVQICKRIPNLENPLTYNDHIMKIMLTPPSKLMMTCADKYAVREYVQQKGEGQLLNELYGVYTDYKSFLGDYAKLPSSFVLKATHGSAWNYVCKDKSRLDLRELRPLVEHWLKSNFYYAQRELVYKEIQPRLICEKYLEEEGGGLTDYKVLCFNGEPEFIQMVLGRYTNKIFNTYDKNGRFVDAYFTGRKDASIPLNPQLPLSEILRYSKILSEDFAYVRVDFYYVQGKLVFGELTFTPGNGHSPLSYEDELYFGSFFNSYV